MHVSGNEPIFTVSWYIRFPTVETHWEAAPDIVSHLSSATISITGIYMSSLSFALQVRVTNNPLAGEAEDDPTTAEIGTSFDNPNHIELPTSTRSVGWAAGSVPIDTTTYCKKDKAPRTFAGKQSKSQSTKSQNNPGVVVSAAQRNG